MKYLPAIAILMSLLGVGCNRLSQAPVTSPDLPKDKMILFTGVGCPHCEVVENKLNSDYQNIPIEVKEVFKNGQNAALLIKALRACGKPLDSSGVPLLWDGSGCHEGDDNILKFLTAYKENNSK